MAVRIMIDPNVRVRGNQTYVDLDSDVLSGDVPQVGTEVEVCEEEAGLVGRARVSEVNRLTGLVYLVVDWSSLRRVEPPEGEGP
jgi:hypothetical protein